MTLLITVIAAVTCTAIWYSSPKAREMKVSTLCWMFWGASLMWFVDAVVEYLEDGAAFFEPAGADMLNDLYLGLSVVALGLVIWIVVLLVKDPQRIVRKTLFANK
ncbi:MAG: hypothetical protein J5509_12080 [Lachnospiraceae bacterium]|nr:hypothetical protein [Lachnospiraceae bacterium]